MKANFALFAALVCLSTSPAFAQYGSHVGHGHDHFGGPVVVSGPSFHRSTEFGDAVDALSLLVDAQGRFERNRSEAYLNLVQAEKLRLQNIVEREAARVASQKLRNELLLVKEERAKIIREQNIASRARYTPPAVMSQTGAILWIEPLKNAAFAAQRDALQKEVGKLARARSLEERDAAMDGVNQGCQDLIEALYSHRSQMAGSSYDSSCRFVNRLYDDLSQPVQVAVSTTLTSR